MASHNPGWNQSLYRTYFPCKECTKREPACHDSCRLYQCYRAMNNITSQRRTEYLIRLGEQMKQQAKEVNTISDKRGRKQNI